MKKGHPPLSRVGEALAFSDAAAEWIRANRSNVPEEFRPEAGELEAFSHLFVSYLATSFEVVDRSAVRACPGCWCCVYWITNKHLRRRDPDKKARATARELKLLYLRRLAEESRRPLSDAELSKFIGDNQDLADALSLATYAHELERRSRFASQGEGVLALWREIAWKEGRPDKKFRLKPEKIIQAEADLRRRLEALE